MAYPLYNLGMLTSGMPDPALRQASEAIKDDAWYQGQQNDWLSDWQKRYDTTPVEWVQTDPGTRDATLSAAQAAYNASAAKTGGSPVDSQYVGSQVNAAYGGDQSSRDILTALGISADWRQPAGFYDDTARKTLEAQKAQQQSQWDLAAQERTANQKAQQDAYTSMLGGGFTGGVIGSGFTTGATGATQAANPTGVSMPWNQPWTALGYGGPTGGTAIGGYGSPANGQATQPTGWGGPFANKNPWASS